MKLLFKITDYIHFLLTAKNTKGFGVHSPFAYQFIINVLGNKHYFYPFTKIENIRKQELRNNETIHITDYGTGSNRESTIRNISKKSVNPAKYGQLLFRIVHYFKFNEILELGTSLGISTMYLAASSSDIQCTTIEGCPEIAGKARKNFERLKLNNIESIIGEIDTALETVLQTKNKLDFIYIDANHKKEAVLKYFEICLLKTHVDSIIIIDDIHWSADMKLAWETIKEFPQVTSTIDIYQMGIVFFNKNLNKNHYKVFY